jgi:DNA-binding NtrC family response regulator
MTVIEVTQEIWVPDIPNIMNVVELRLPPLRDRRSAIPKIALHVLDQVNAGFRRPRRLAPSALSQLQHHSWPGNVRDLENVIERSLRLATKDVLEADDLLISEPIMTVDPLARLPGEGRRRAGVWHTSQQSNGQELTADCSCMSAP